jgi:transposase-like protein
MSKPKRRRFSPEEKATIIKQHLADKVEVSVLCEEHGLQPSVFYEWRNQLFADAALALQDRRRTRRDPQQKVLEAERRKVEKLTEQLGRKDYVIAKLAEENVELKKGLGEL